MSPAFFRVAAIASLLSAISTLTLIFVPNMWTPPADLSARMALVDNDWYQLRAWTYLFHPMFVFLAALGIGAVVWHRSRALALTGTITFGIWAVTEAAQQCLTLFAFDRWRRLWLAGDEAVRQTMELRAAIYDGLWDAMYDLLIFGFFAGNLLFAAALRKGDRFDRTIAVFLLLAALLTLTTIITEFGGPYVVPGAIDPYLYPAIQPLGRALIGVWLWRQASRLLGAGSAGPAAGAP